MELTFMTGLGCGVVIGAVSVLSLRLFGQRRISNNKPVSLDDEYRLILVVRTDLNMSKGKIAAQCGHAAVGCIEKAQRKDPESLQKYKVSGATSVALKIDSVESIRELAHNARNMNVITSLVRDAGRTQIAPNSITVLGIGPAHKNVIEGLTGHLKPL